MVKRQQPFEFVVVIPARMSGERLPGKPLLPILGKPMLQHVYERCSVVTPKDKIYVATEDDEIVRFCNSMEYNVVKTNTAHTAIDRIFLFSEIIDAMHYITVLGDEPLVNPQDIATVIDSMECMPGRVYFGKTLANKDEFDDPSKAKVVCAPDGRLLYSSRAGIPVDKFGNYSKAYRAIWIYGFPKKSLQNYFTGNDAGHLEKLESNEILRFIEIGESVYCVDVVGNSWAVDEPKDLAIVEQLMLESTR